MRKNVLEEGHTEGKGIASDVGRAKRPNGREEIEKKRRERRW